MTGRYELDRLELGQRVALVLLYENELGPRSRWRDR